MDLALTILFFAVGLVLIIKGGDWFVDSAAWIAKVSGIPEFIIGATIVSVATTLPELVVSIVGTIEGEVDMAVGNAVGSVTANLGLIMGISIVCIPAVISRKQFALKALLMVLAALMLMLFGFSSNIGIVAAIVLIAIFAVYAWRNVIDAKRSAEEEPMASADKKQMPKKIMFFIIGIACIVGGSNLLINYGSKLAAIIGVPSAIIGVTVVAIGTSLPELVTTITAIIKKEADMSIGNIIGANIIDLTLILPICSFISGGNLPIAKQSYMLDMPICLCIALMGVIPPLIAKRFRRWQGVLMLCSYAAYVVAVVIKFA